MVNGLPRCHGLTKALDALAIEATAGQLDIGRLPGQGDHPKPVVALDPQILKPWRKTIELL